ESRHEAQKLRAGQLLVDERPVRDETQLALRRDRIGGDIDPADLHRSARCLEDSGNDAKRGRLAGAIRSEEAEQLTPRHLEIDPVRGGEAAVAFREIGELDHFAALETRRAAAPLTDRTSILRLPMSRSSSV